MRRPTPVALALAALLTASTLAPPARADSGSGKGVLALMAVALGLVVADVVFVVQDVRMTAETRNATRLYAGVEAGVCGAQGLAASIAHSVALAQRPPREDSGLDALYLFFQAWMGATTAHGVWSLAAPRAVPTYLHGASAVVGIDAILTATAVTRLATGPLWGKRGGLAVTLLSTPGLIGSATAIGTGRAGDRPLWIGLTAWSGLLFSHGIVSAFAGPNYGAPTRKKSATQVWATPITLQDAQGPVSGFGVAGVF